MTYPPQPEQPYGRQPGGFPPQPGGYPQPGPQVGGHPGAGGGYPQPGPYQGVGGFPQQPYGAPGYGNYPGPGYGGFGAYPGYGGPQPPKRRKGLWIGLSLGLVVVLAALGITGFWQPGFFVGKPGPTHVTPEAALRGIVDGLNKHDETALTTLKCTNADPKITNAINNAGQVTDAKLISGPIKVSNTEYDGVISITYHGETDRFTGKLANENGNWCWQDASDSQST